jgi:hypothetical protein
MSSPGDFSVLDLAEDSRASGNSRVRVIPRRVACWGVTDVPVVRVDGLWVNDVWRPCDFKGVPQFVREDRRAQGGRQ